MAQEVGNFLLLNFSKMLFFVFFLKDQILFILHHFIYADKQMVIWIYAGMNTTTACLWRFHHEVLEHIWALAFQCEFPEQKLLLGLFARVAASKVKHAELGQGEEFLCFQWWWPPQDCWEAGAGQGALWGCSLLAGILAAARPSWNWQPLHFTSRRLCFTSAIEK